MVGECLAWLRRSVFVVRHADKRVLASVVLVLAGGGGIEGAAELLAKLLAETAQLLAKLVHRALKLLAVEAAAELEAGGLAALFAAAGLEGEAVLEPAGGGHHVHRPLGDHQVLEQIQKQLGKLEDVHDIKELREGHSVYRELMLVKVRANANQRMAINAISEIFRASIVDVGKDSVTVMLTGDQSKQDALINLLEDYEILELARTGLTGLSRGADDIRYLP